MVAPVVIEAVVDAVPLKVLRDLDCCRAVIELFEDNRRVAAEIDHDAPGKGRGPCLPRESRSKAVPPCEHLIAPTIAAKRGVEGSARKLVSRPIPAACGMPRFGLRP